MVKSENTLTDRARNEQSCSQTDCKQADSFTRLSKIIDGEVKPKGSADKMLVKITAQENRACSYCKVHWVKVETGSQSVNCSNLTDWVIYLFFPQHFRLLFFFFQLRSHFIHISLITLQCHQH